MACRDAKWASTSSKIWSTRSTSPRRLLCAARSCSRAAMSSRLNEAVIDVSDKKENGLGAGAAAKGPARILWSCAEKDEVNERCCDAGKGGKVASVSGRRRVGCIAVVANAGVASLDGSLGLLWFGAVAVGGCGTSAQGDWARCGMSVGGAECDKGAHFCLTSCSCLACHKMTCIGRPVAPTWRASFSSFLLTVSIFLFPTTGCSFRGRVHHLQGGVSRTADWRPKVNMKYLGASKTASVILKDSHRWCRRANSSFRTRPP